MYFEAFNIKFDFNTELDPIDKEDLIEDVESITWIANSDDEAIEKIEEYTGLIVSSVSLVCG